MNIDHITRSPAFPYNVRDWRACASNGWSVAHEAALRGVLPRYFTAWEIADCQGRTVAHVWAALGRDFPPEFDGWELSTPGGLSVREAYTIAKRLG